MNQQYSTWKKYRSTKIDFTTFNKCWKGLLLLSIAVGLVPLFMNVTIPFSQTLNGVSAIPTIAFGVISMLAICALGIAVLVRHYRQAKQ